MADIKQAAKWMQKGRRVYSVDSQRSQSIYMNENELFYGAVSGVRTFFHLEDLLADDWEISQVEP